jgi:DNA-binding CsgD family transcriptional regulator
MDWLSKAEKEEIVIQLYKENKSFREIATLMHMSFRDISAITKKVELQAAQERGYAAKDIEPKSRESQALKMFSEGRSPVEVAIRLDLAVDRVRAIYREYWELTGRFELAQIYDEARSDLGGLLGLYKIVKDLEMQEQDIKKVFELAKYNQLEILQWKVQYLTEEVNMLEFQKAKATSDILKLNSAMNQLESSLPVQQRGEEMNQERRWYDNNGNLYPMEYSQPDIDWYSLDISYTYE